MGSDDRAEKPAARHRTWVQRHIAREERRARLRLTGAPPPGIVLLACMKNEGPAILEWVAYHLAIGVEHFLIYTNDCADGTDLIWQRLAQLGLATHRDNTAEAGLAAKPQTRALVRALTEKVYTDADWVLVIDADEFLNIHAGDGSIGALLAQNPDADCFFVNWRLFGSSGQQDFSAGLLMEQFPMAADPDRVRRHHALAPKSLFRPQKFPKAGIHRPTRPAEDGSVIYAADDGTPCSRSWAGLVLGTRYAGAQVNHYSVQSLDMLLLKFARGFAVTAQMESPRAYLESRDFNHQRDETILRHLPRVRAELDRLMADPLLARLHRKALMWRQDQIRTALSQPELRAVKNELIAAQKRLLRRALMQSQRPGSPAGEDPDS